MSMTIAVTLTGPMTPALRDALYELGVAAFAPASPVPVPAEVAPLGVDVSSQTPPAADKPPAPLGQSIVRWTGPMKDYLQTVWATPMRVREIAEALSVMSGQIVTEQKCYAQAQGFNLKRPYFTDLAFKTPPEPTSHETPKQQSMPAIPAAAAAKTQVLEPVTVNRTLAVRWAAERGIPEDDFTLAGVNAKRTHLGLPPFRFETQPR